MANNRLMNQTLSPSLRSRMKYKRKAKLESMQKEILLATTKETFTKVILENDCLMSCAEVFEVLLIVRIFIDSFHRLLIGHCQIPWMNQKQNSKHLSMKSKVEMPKQISNQFVKICQTYNQIGFIIFSLINV